MDIKLDLRSVDNGFPTTSEGAQAAPVSAQGVSAPVLNGNGLCLTAAFDLQRLVEMMKMDQEDTHQKLVSQQFSSVLLRLAAENGQITAAQQAAVAAIGKATDDLNARKAELGESAKSYEAAKNAYETDLGTLEARLAELEAKKGELSGNRAALAELDREIAELTVKLEAAKGNYADALVALAKLTDSHDATVALMNLAIAELEALVEAQQTTPEERAQEQEDKERKAERIAELKKQIAGYEATLAALDADIAVQQGTVDSLSAALTQLNAALDAKNDARQQLNGIVSSLETSVADLEQMTGGLRAQVASEAVACEEKAAALKAAESAWEAAGRVLSASIAALDGIGVSVLAQAIAVTAAQVTQTAAEMPDEEKAEEKAAAVLKLAEATLKAIEERQDEELAKLVAKLPGAVGDLLGAPRTLMPTDLPGYELRA